MMRFSLGEITMAMACWRRSVRVTAAFRKAATDSDALAMRTLSIPAEIDGSEMAVTSAMIETTTIISISVTPVVPLLRFPTDDIGIQSIAARRSVGAQANDVRFISVLARIF